MSVILAHPNRQSFNHAIAAACVQALDLQGYEVPFHDLYAEQFDSLLPFEEFGRDAMLPPLIGQLRAQSAVVFNTSNTTEERERSVFGDPLESIWKRCIFGRCGVTSVYRRTFCIVVTSTELQRQQWLAEVSRVIEEQYPGMSHNQAL